MNNKEVLDSLKRKLSMVYELLYEYEQQGNKIAISECYNTIETLKHQISVLEGE